MLKEEYVVETDRENDAMHRQGLEEYFLVFEIYWFSTEDKVLAKGFKITEYVVGCEVQDTQTSLPRGEHY